MTKKPSEIKIFGLSFGILIFATLFCNISLFAQQQETDTIVPIRKNAEEILKKLNLNSDGFNFWKDKFSGHWAGIDFGFNMFFDPDYTAYDNEFMKNDILNSHSIHLNILQQSFGLQRNRNNFGLVTGLGMQFQYYKLNDSITIERSDNDLIIPVPFEYSEHQKSKLFLLSVTLPVLAEIQIPINNYKNRLYFSSGMYMSYRIASYSRIKYREEQKKKLTTIDNFSLQNFKYGIMFRTGYRWINFYAMYELTPFFKEGKGPDLTPFTVGLTLLRF